jgi:hypothetical protein
MGLKVNKEIEVIKRNFPLHMLLLHYIQRILLYIILLNILGPLLKHTHTHCLT